MPEQLRTPEGRREFFRQAHDAHPGTSSLRAPPPPPPTSRDAQSTGSRPGPSPCHICCPSPECPPPTERSRRRRVPRWGRVPRRPANSAALGLVSHPAYRHDQVPVAGPAPPRIRTAMVTRFAGSAGALQAPRCLQGADGSLRDRGADRRHDPRGAGCLHPVLLFAPGGPLRRAGHHLLQVRSAPRARAHLPLGTAGAALGAVRGGPGRRPPRFPGSRLLHASCRTRRWQPRVPIGRAQAAQAQLPHAVRARRGRTGARMTFPLRAVRPGPGRGATSGNRAGPADPEPRMYGSGGHSWRRSRFPCVRSSRQDEGRPRHRGRCCLAPRAPVDNIAPSVGAKRSSGAARLGVQPHTRFVANAIAAR